MNGLKFKYLSFNTISKDYKGVSIWINNKEVAYGSIDEVLINLSKLKDSHEIPNYEIINTRTYFDIFIIELNRKN